MEKSRKIGVAISAVSLLCLILSAYGVLTTLIIPNEGSVSYLSAAWDAGFTNPVTTVSWGALAPNTTNTKTIYIKNFGVQTLNLSMSTQKWVPAIAPNYMNVSWNLEHTLLAGKAFNTATITLTIYENITQTWNATTPIGAFSFEIVITGTG